MEQTERLKIKAENLGNIENIIEFLTDLEFAYNSLYTFDFMIASFEAQWQRDAITVRERLSYLRELRKEFDKGYPDFLLFEFFENYWLSGRTRNGVSEFQQQLKSKNVILPGDRLKISKINIQSPGSWEILGISKIIKQIREYIKDRHERQKDRNFRTNQEDVRGNIELYQKKEEWVQQRIETLRKLNYTESEIRQMIAVFVDQPLEQLGRHQDTGLIGGPDDEQ